MKGVFWKEGEPFTNSMSLIVSLLLRYPEIATLKLDPEEKSILFTFMFSRRLTPMEIKELRALLWTNLEALHAISQNEPEILKISIKCLYDLSLLEIKRDTITLCQEEIALLLGIIKEKHAEELITDQDEEMGEDELIFQEEMIGHMLEDLRDSGQEKKLIGIREEGRVMIFNRS